MPKAKLKVTEVSTRESKKLEKRERIRAAADALFRSKGFDATTTTEVAKKADVAKGTLFLYAADKNDLLFLVMHDRLQQTVDARFATLPKQGLTEQLVHLVKGLFEMYAHDEQLARSFVAVLPASRGPQADRVNALTFMFLHQVGQLVAAAKERKEVGAHVDEVVAAQTFFAIYFMALQAWLSGVATREFALEGLKAALLQLHRGLRP